jgi:hypothetical protein
MLIRAMPCVGYQLPAAAELRKLRRYCQTRVHHRQLQASGRGECRHSSRNAPCYV